MSIQELLTGGGCLLLALMTLVQIAPVKVNPWSWLATAIGRAINAEVINKLDAHITILTWVASTHQGTLNRLQSWGLLWSIFYPTGQS